MSEDGLGMIRVEFGQPMGRRWDRDLQCGHLSPLPSARRDSLRCIPAMRRTPVHTSLPRPCTGVPSPLVRPTLAGALRSGTPRSTEARNRWLAGIFSANHNQSRFYPGLGANREAAGPSSRTATHCSKRAGPTHADRRLPSTRISAWIHTPPVDSASTARVIAVSTQQEGGFRVKKRVKKHGPARR